MRKRLKEQARQIESELAELHSRLVKVRRELSGGKVKDYCLETMEGTRYLSQFFSDSGTLLLIHNMGSGCSYCTVYADGINGILQHLCGFSEVLLVSPDEPQVQHAFAESRRWQFKLASTRGTELSHDLGFEPNPKEYWPGLCVLRKEADNTLALVAQDAFEPGDRYSPLWHVKALVEGNYDLTL